jgi:predicted RNase H-like nuclease (RuvC/YqgF family)
MNKKELFSILKKAIIGGKDLFYDAKTTDGKIVRIDGDVLETGLSIYEILEDGAIAALDDGDYILESGETIKVAGGVISDFIPVSAEVVEDEVIEDEISEDSTDAEEVVEEIAESTVEEIEDEMDWEEAVKALAEELVEIKEIADEMKKKYNKMAKEANKFSKEKFEEVEEAVESGDSAEIVEALAEATEEEIAEETNWEDAVHALAEEIIDMKESVEEMKKKFGFMKTKLSRFSKEPSEDGIKRKKVGSQNFKEEVKDVKTRNLESIRNLRAKK